MNSSSRNPVYELKQLSSSDQSSDENYELPTTDRIPINRQSMSSFHEKEINEQVKKNKNNTNSLNQSLSK
jgi:hypothetical protein